MDELSRLVHQFRSIRLAPGIAGKSAYIAVAAMMVLGVVAFRIDTTDRGLTLVLIGAVIVVLLLPIAGMIFFAWHRPGPALLEGAELIAWQQSEHVAKGIGPLPERPPITNPRAHALPPRDADADAEEPEAP